MVKNLIINKKESQVALIRARLIRRPRALTSPLASVRDQRAPRLAIGSVAVVGRAKATTSRESLHAARLAASSNGLWVPTLDATSVQL